MRYFAAIIALCLLLNPAESHAAFDDATLTVDAVISVGGYTLNISGSSAVIQSITVNASDFSVVLASGSSIKIQAPGLNVLSNDFSSDVSASVCTSAESSLTLSYSGGGTVTNTITPQATLCTGSGSTADTGSGVSSQNFSYGGPGGGGVISTVKNAILGLIFGTPKTSPYIFVSNLKVGSTGIEVTYLQTWLIDAGYDIPAITSGLADKGYFGSQTQAALIRYQGDHDIPPTGFFGPISRASVNGNPLMIETTAICPEGYTCRSNTIGSASSSSSTFQNNLAAGSTGPDVIALQTWLIEHGYDIPSISSGRAYKGYFGSETQAAVMLYQSKNGIPDTGFFGPLTRASINANTPNKVEQVVCPDGYTCKPI